jgi:hypothetical protein
MKQRPPKSYFGNYKGGQREEGRSGKYTLFMLVLLVQLTSFPIVHDYIDLSYFHLSERRHMLQAPPVTWPCPSVSINAHSKSLSLLPSGM